MHGEDGRPAARPPCLVVIEEKNQCLRADVLQRVILAAMRWVDADSAVDEQEGTPCPSDDGNWAHCPHHSTRLCARRLHREEDGESPSAHR